MQTITGRKQSSTAGIMVLFAAFAVVAPGCEKTDDSQGKVTGEVKLNGQPLSGGVVRFLYADPKTPPVTSLILGNGHFTMFNAAPGDVKIVVEGPKPSNDPMQKGIVPVKVPDRYKDRKRSGLDYTVIAGDQVKNIELQTP
jgi:hypothetical protein